MINWYCPQGDTNNTYLMRYDERGDKTMTMTRKAINELKQLRGATVKYWGEAVTLSDNVGEFEIDILDILEAMEEFEIDPYDFTYWAEDEDGNEVEIDILENCETAEDVLDTLEEYGYIEDTYFAADNSYNWSAPVSNDFDFKDYRDFVSDGVFVDFMVHRFGDVRGNYTDSVIYHFDSVGEFYELLSNCNKYVQIGNYGVCVDIFNDGFEVYDEAGNYICTAYGDYDDVVEAIKNAEAA